MKIRLAKPAGWKGESYRHYLAAKGVKTGKGYYARSMVQSKWGDLVNESIEASRESRRRFIDAQGARSAIDVKQLTERPATVAEQQAARLAWERTLLRPGVRTQMELLEAKRAAEAVLGLREGSLQTDIPSGIASFNPDAVDVSVALKQAEQLRDVARADLEAAQASKQETFTPKMNYLYYETLVRMIEDGVPANEAAASVLTERRDIFGGTSSDDIVAAVKYMSGEVDTPRRLPKSVKVSFNRRGDETPEEIAELQKIQPEDFTDGTFDPNLYAKRVAGERVMQEKELETAKMLPVGGKYSPTKLTQVNISVSPSPKLGVEDEPINITPEGERIDRVASSAKDTFQSMGLKGADVDVMKESAKRSKMDPKQFSETLSFAEGLMGQLKSMAAKQGMLDPNLARESAMPEARTPRANYPYSTEQEYREATRKWKVQGSKKKGGDTYVPEPGDEE